RTANSLGTPLGSLGYPDRPGPEPVNPARDAAAVLLRLLGTGTVCVVLPHHPGYDLLPPERLHPSSRGGIRSQDRNAERIRQETPAVPAAPGATSPLDGARRCGKGRGCRSRS